MPRALLPRITDPLSASNPPDSAPASTVVERATVANNSGARVSKGRQIIASACQSCRKSKAKCDGQRPVCGRCSTKNLECSNVSDQDNLKSSRALREQHSKLKEKNEKLNELFALLSTLPEAEAQDVFVRIRNTGDPLKVLRDIADSRILISNSDTFSKESLQDPRLVRIDLEALKASPLRVTARPWTAVASDGIVSQLISSFFTWDNAFFSPFVHRKAFMDDMQQRNPSTAKYCSPFLVNAICAVRCFTARRVKACNSITGRILGIQFLDEAKKLLDLENNRPSLPTAQGLALLFTISGHEGKDRAGVMYRFACYDMLRHLDLETKFEEARLNNSPAVEQEAISKAVWGFFCFESILSYVYLQLSRLRPPYIPRLFESMWESSQSAQGNVDILGNPYESNTEAPPFVPGALDAQCELSLFLYKSMLWSSLAWETSSSSFHNESRVALVKEVFRWCEDLPRCLKYDENFTPQTGFLRILAHEVVYSALRSLPVDTLVWHNMTTTSLVLWCCEIDTNITDRYFETYSFRDYSCMAWCGIYNTLLNVTPHLAIPSTHKTFTKACRLMFIGTTDYPMCRFILQGIKAMVWALKLSIPPEAAAYFENLGGSKADLRDVPLGFALPSAEGADLLGGSGSSGKSKSIDMGKLLSEWSRLSIE